MEQLIQLKQKNILWIILSIVVGILISWPLFGPYYLNPNAYMFAFAGDAYILYYNVAYHAIYGNSHTLTNMCYPDGELIFMTDAQGSLSMLLQKLNNFISIGDYTVGIINGLNVYSYLVSVVLFYLIFIAVGVKKERAWLYAPFIAIMSPQLSRIISHHGLANLMLLPLCVLWFIRKYKLQTMEKRDVFMFVILLFYSFNNPYIGFMLTTFLFLSFVILMIIHRKVTFNLTYLSCISILPLIFLMIYLWIFDDYTDRLKLQWGYFVYRSNFEGLFFSPHGLFGTSIKTIFNKQFNIEAEADLNIYLVLTFALIGRLIYFFTRSKKEYKTIFPIYIKVPLIAAFIIFLYSSGILFLPFSKDFVETFLGKLLMFKAVARLGWPFWMMLSISGIILLDNFLDSINGVALKVIFPSIVFLFLLESSLDIRGKFLNTRHPNFFSKNKMTELSAELANSKIVFENYQAMLLLPKMMAWHDNFSSDVSFNAQFNGIRISLLKNIPLISGMFSRISTSQIAERIEFISHPLIEKSLQNKFPDKRKILILVGKDNPLKTGEQELVKRGGLLFENEAYQIFEFDPFKVNENDQLMLAQSLILSDSIKLTKYYHEGFDDSPSNSVYFGKGSVSVITGDHEIVSFNIESGIDSIFTFSAWTKIDNEKYGVGFWEVVIKDEKGNEKERLYYEIRKSNDVHDNWIRSELTFGAKEGYKVAVNLKAQRTLIIDEIHIKPQMKHTVIEGKDSFRLFDGFKVRKMI